MRSFKVKLGDFYILPRDLDVLVVFQRQRQGLANRQRFLAIHVHADATKLGQRFLRRMKIGSDGGHLQILRRWKRRRRRFLGQGRESTAKGKEEKREDREAERKAPQRRIPSRSLR